MIFIDASAMVAMIAREPDGRSLMKKLVSETGYLCSALSMWETMAALCKNYRYSVVDARIAVADFVRDIGIVCAPISANESELAALAYEKFGKGRHKAALNMGDCFAYACAKTHNARLLYKGDDFALTDIQAA